MDKDDISMEEKDTESTPAEIEEEQELEIPDESVYEAHCKTIEVMMKQRERDDTSEKMTTEIFGKDKRIEIVEGEPETWSQSRSMELASVFDEDTDMALGGVGNIKPLSSKSLSEIGIRTEPPFEGAVEGRDYVIPMEETDEHGKPTGKKFIPADSEHVRSLLDPFYNKNKTEDDIDIEKAVAKEMVLRQYGFEDPKTGEFRFPENDEDIEILAKQKGWTLRRPIEEGSSVSEGLPILSGGFGTSPEKQGFKRSGCIPVDELMFKLVSVNNTLKYESQLVSEVGIDVLLKTPPYFSILSTSRFPDVMNSHNIFRYVKIYEDMFVDMYSFDKDHDYTMAGTGTSVENSLPELSLLSLEESEMKVLGIESLDRTEMIKAAPQARLVPLEDTPIEKIPEKISPEERNEKGTIKTVPPKRKLADFWLKEGVQSINPMDWCPHLGKKEASEQYTKALEKWFECVVENTNTEIEHLTKNLEEKNKRFMEKERGIKIDETPPLSSHSDEVEMQEEGEDESMKEGEVKEEEEEGDVLYDDDDLFEEKSPGEPIHNWFCCFSGGDTIDKTGVSSFFRRFVREGWLIKLINRDMLLKQTSGTGGYVTASCLHQIVEHWKSVCTLDIATRGGHDKLFPSTFEEEIRVFSEFLLDSLKKTWENEGFSYVNNISTFLGQLSTDFVLHKIWRKPEEVVDFKYPTSSQVIELLMPAEDVVEELTLEEIPVPQCNDCEAFHREWSYHWMNRQLVNLEAHLMGEIASKTEDSINMYKMEMAAIKVHGMIQADIKEHVDKLPPHHLRESMNGSFLFDINRPMLDQDRLFKYPKLLHEIFISFHVYMVNKLCVLSLYLQMLTARWVPVPVRKKFGFISSSDPYDDIVKKVDVDQVVLKRHVFMRRANMQTKLRSVGLEAKSSIYDILVIKPDDTIADIDLDVEGERCLFGDVTYPELDLMGDALRYLAKINNNDERPSEENYFNLLKNAIANKARFMIPEGLDIGNQFTSTEMQRMLEVTEQFKDPIIRTLEIPKKENKREANSSSGRGRGRGKRRGKKSKGRRR